MSKKLSAQFENNRESILATASSLFCRKGINATSFSDISKDVKLSKGTIYYYYPSKDHLVYEVTDYHLGQVTDAIISWIEDVDEKTSLEDALGMLFGRVFDTVDKCRLHIILVSHSITGNEIINNMIKEKAAKWRTMTEAGLVKSGCAKPRRITDAVFTAIDSIILRRIMGAADMRENEICAYIAGNV